MRDGKHNSGFATAAWLSGVALLFVLQVLSAAGQLPTPAEPSTTETVTPPLPAASQSSQTPGSESTSTSAMPSATGEANGQATSLATIKPAPPIAAETGLKPAPGVLVDQVIGIVNGDLILESDVLEERRFEAFQPYRSDANFSRVAIIRRLVDRQLILQQAKLNPDNKITDAEAEGQLDKLRKDIPACRQYHCETQAGWDRFVAAQGFTQRELLDRWKQRMEILRFIETRFRMGVQITPAQIKTYYDSTLLPQFAAKRVAPPTLASISDRIQEILLQQQVSSLLEDWLKQLKAQGNMRMMRPDEVQP